MTVNVDDRCYYNILPFTNLRWKKNFKPENKLCCLERQYLGENVGAAEKNFLYHFKSPLYHTIFIILYT